MHATGRLARAAMVALALALAGCGEDGDKVVSTSTLARYCDLAGQLDQAAAGTGAASAPGTFDGGADAVGKLMAQVGPTLAELQSAAPSKVRGDVKTTVAALEKAKTGDLTDLRSPKVVTAARKVATFRAESCRGGAGSNDG